MDYPREFSIIETTRPIDENQIDCADKQARLEGESKSNLCDSLRSYSLNL